MRWLVSESAREEVETLASELGVHPLLAQILRRRGLSTPAAASAYLSTRLQDLPDPFLMKGMPETVARLMGAIEQEEPVTLYGDYDVDGVCSTTLLSLFLESLGVRVSTYIPHRLEEGYGLNAAAIERLAQDGTKMLVTLDCGITSHAEVALANRLGMQVVVVDHHAVPEVMPPALAVLNPHQPGCQYPTRHLCAAGVAFNLCMALRKGLRDKGFFSARQMAEPLLKSYLDLVALATVADVVPLTGANRILVSQGLVELSAAKRPGVRALKEVAGLGVLEPVTAGQVGFRLGPRINAAGRLDDASIGLQLLRAQTLEEARPLAQLLDGANGERQAIEGRILTEALSQASQLTVDRGLVLYSEDWHPGVIGIVASRVVEKYHRPAVVVGVHDGLGRGSGRSIEAFHLLEGLQECAPHLVRLGGHKHAAGLTIEPGKLPAFREAFARVANARLTEADLEPRCVIDAIVEPSLWDEKTIEALEVLGPYGNGNPQPVFASRRLSGRPRVLKSKQEGRPGHLKLSLEGLSGIDVIGFGMEEKLPLTEGPLDLAYQVSLDEWNGRRRVSWKLKDAKTSGQA